MSLAGCGLVWIPPPALNSEPVETFCLPIMVAIVVVSSTSIWIESILLPREIICGGVVVGLSKEITCVLVVDFVVVWLSKEISCLLVVDFVVVW